MHSHFVKKKYSFACVDFNEHILPIIFTLKLKQKKNEDYIRDNDGDIIIFWELNDNNVYDYYLRTDYITK